MDTNVYNNEHHDHENEINK